MHQRMYKSRSLKLRRYAACLIDLNEYLDSFPGVTLADKIGILELNETLLNSTPTIWPKHYLVQVFDCESISFKKAFNMFKQMEIAEFIFCKCSITLLLETYPGRCRPCWSYQE